VTDGDKLVPGQLGMALCDGYDAMRLALSKPHLRAELEADLKRICDGAKNGNTVKMEQIAKYREVFRTASQQLEKLESACSEYLNEPPLIEGFLGR